MSPEFWLQLAGTAGACCVVYAGIKADLVRAILLAEMAMRDTAKAHERITEHCERYHPINHTFGGQ